MNKSTISRNTENTNGESPPIRPHHLPVMLEEVVALLRCQPSTELRPGSPPVYVDGTLGGGGHAFEILNRTGPDGILIGMDWDEDAISEARKVLMVFGERAKIFRENFIHLPHLLSALQIGSVRGILIDLGLSSLQIERQERGFSLKGDGPLDMRMDRRVVGTAADLVKCLSLQELEKTLREFGEERWAKRIAKAIVLKRESGSILTTQALRKIVLDAIPRRFHSRRIDPATRTFQAFRIRVNEELKNLKQVLETGWTLLEQGGRMCVVSFHSLEDRLVKETFRKLEREGTMRVVTRKPITPSQEEEKKNPRSRSAKLRCAERV